MHIPDGFLDAKTWVTMTAVAIGCTGGALRRAQKELQERDVPVLGMMGAFIFAAQMVNFPVAVGTSGHLLGGALATATLGPWAATVVMTAVVIVQALFFRDGGITALGANVLNMAVVGPWLAYGVYRLIPVRSRIHQGVAAFMAGWISVIGAAGCAALQLALSGTAALSSILPMLMFWHALIGVGEGVITAAVLLYLSRAGRTLFRLAPYFQTDQESSADSTIGR